MKLFKSTALTLLLILLASGCGKEPDPVIIPPVYPDQGNGSDEKPDPEPGPGHQVLPPFTVDCKKNITTASWTQYTAFTVDCIEGFVPLQDPETDVYGGWPALSFGNPDGFFRVKKSAGRWWLVDPEGNAFLSKAVAVFSPGSSARQKENVRSKFGSNSNWAQTETVFLKEQGFNSLGAWSSVDVVRNIPEPMPYTVIFNPMGNYNKYLKSTGTESAGYAAAGWEGYPYDFPMVFNPEFDVYVENALSAAAVYRNDKYCIGYFVDNEIPWKDYALERCLTKWPASHVNHQVAQKWLDERKGRSGCTISDATTADKKAFIAYCLDVYLDKVTKVLKKHDPNHLFLGCRFNQWNYELQNEEIFKVAGKYMDIISINHYQRWQPEQAVMANWANWSGRPFFITEFYTKGLDSELGNNTGAGWVVKTQADRGLFYQNFVNELIKSKVCVGWHWFTYMDNDPTNTGADPSNIDSNKGMVKWNCDRYYPLTDQMKQINNCTYNLVRFYDR